MAKAVFTTKVDPTYDDLPEVRYHFPRTYLRAVEQTLDDRIVYYEPRRTSGDPSSRGGRQSYFATARVTEIREDPLRPEHFYAFVADFLEFDTAVSFRDGEHYYEGALRREDGRTSKGAFGRAVRLLPEHEFKLILQAAYAAVIGQADQYLDLQSVPDLAEESASLERPIIERVIARPFRDAAFARHVKSAYDDTCAVTGIKLINGGGRAEVQAAHIRPVAAQGPDSTRNGIALSGTFHWMFDRGLISVDDDFGILMAKDRIPDSVGKLVNANGQLLVPGRPDLRPHPQFLRYHREAVFKG